MTKLEDTLKRMQLNVERLVARKVPHESEPLYTNNQNRQMMIRYEIFWQTAYAMIGDGSVQLAIEMMTRVANELRAYERAGAAKGATVDPESFRKRWMAAFSFEKQGWFIDMKEIDEIDADDESNSNPIALA